MRMPSSNHLVPLRYQFSTTHRSQCRSKCLSSYESICDKGHGRCKCSGICAGMLGRLPSTTTRGQMLTWTTQDPEPSSPGPSPNFILKLNNDDELTFNFTFIIRQTQQPNQGANGAQAAASLVDTTVNGLTYVSASTAKEVETLVTREFHADPNLHKNANVQLVGDFGTGGSPSVSFEWSWKWRSPKVAEDRGGGWRNECSVSSLLHALSRYADSRSS